jgi:hypothetical protein
MPAVLVDRHVADFDVRGPIRPFPDVQYTNQIFTADQDDLVLSRADQFESVFAMNGKVLLVSPGLQENRVAFASGIDGLLNRPEIPGSVEGHHNGSRSKR